MGFIFLYDFYETSSWRKRLDARLPPLGSRVRVSVPPCGFRGGRNGVWVGFSRVSPVFLYHKFHSTTSPHSSHPFRFISSALVMVRQAWSAGPIIQGLHRISSLDPTLCWTRVEDIFFNGFACVSFGTFAFFTIKRTAIKVSSLHSTRNHNEH